jgi:tetratricopeptide (TPR) repeat protein
MLRTRLTASILILAILSLFTNSILQACIWPIDEKMVGKPIPVESLSGQALVETLRSHEGRDHWEKIHADILQQQKSFGKIATTDNDLAVVLLHLGKIKEAIALLENMEKGPRRQYYVAANLGTAYELNGENEKALQWIRKAMDRNPDSHYDTEWLHVKILEAKIAISRDPQWLEGHSVIGLPDGQAGAISLTDHTGRLRGPSEIEKALAYQLHERLEFTPKPYAIVADLLFDFSKVLAVTRGPEHADAIFELARVYGPNHKEILKKGSGETVPVALVIDRRPSIIYTAVGFALILCVIGGVAILRRRRRVRSSLI